jgi:putative transposase
MIEYKSKICGIKVSYIDPKYTSQKCSKCGLIGNRNGKKFVCSNENCKHVDHADSNAAFNIANAAFELNEIDKECDDQLSLDRDNGKGNTDIPKLETQLTKNESFWEVA